MSKNNLVISLVVLFGFSYAYDCTDTVLVAEKLVLLVEPGLEEPS